MNVNLNSSFSKMSLALLTTYRCFAGDCASPDGTPLQLHLYEEYGFGIIVLYMLLFLFVTLGLFNLIMAVIVDAVSQSGKTHRMEALSFNTEKNESRLRHVIRRCATRVLMKSQMSQIGHENLRDEDIIIGYEEFCQILENEDCIHMLEILGVETINKDEVFDCLDADMSGRLDINELVTGLMFLRGAVEKKDAVACWLSSRVTQVLVVQLQERLCVMHDEQHKMNKKLNLALGALSVQARP